MSKLKTQKDEILPKVPANVSPELYNHLSMLNDRLAVIFRNVRTDLDYILDSDVGVTGVVPVGGIVSYLPGYFQSNANGTYTAVSLTLPPEWKVCDGSALNDADSPIWNASGRYVPNLTDSRFFMGSGTRGSTGGATSNTLTVDHIPQHLHSIDHDHASVTSGNNSVTHTHTGPSHKHISPYLTNTTTAGSYIRSGHTGASNGTNDRIIQQSAGSYDQYYLETKDSGTGNTGNNSASHTHSVDVAAYTGNSGNYGTASPTALENRPLYLSCSYIVRIK